LGAIKEENPQMNKETAKVYELLANVTLKALIVVVMLASWLVILICLILKPSVYLAVATAVLPTLVIILKHYFK